MNILKLHSITHRWLRSRYEAIRKKNMTTSQNYTTEDEKLPEPPLHSEPDNSINIYVEQPDLATITNTETSKSKL